MPRKMGAPAPGAPPSYATGVGVRALYYTVSVADEAFHIKMGNA